MFHKEKYPFKATLPIVSALVRIPYLNANLVDTPEVTPFFFFVSLLFFRLMKVKNFNYQARNDSIALLLRLDERRARDVDQEILKEQKCKLEYSREGTRCFILFLAFLICVWLLLLKE
jgi:hypothetical protein